MIVLNFKLLKEHMKTLMVLLIAIAALLSGCVVYDEPYRDGAGRRDEHHRDRDYERHDRDGRGTPDRDERDDDYRRR